MALTKVTNSVVSSGSATDGYVLTADGSGGSAWEASAGGVDGIVSSADATAITIDSSERVGIGTGSPSYKLEVSGTQNNNDIVTNNTTTGVGVRIQSIDAYGNIFTTGAKDLYLGTNNTTRLQIGSSGGMTLNQSSDTNAYFTIDGVTGSYYWAKSTWGVFSAGDPTATESFRIKGADGTLLVNRTSTFGSPSSTAMLVTGKGASCAWWTAPNTAGYDIHTFYNGGLGVIGTIEQNSSLNGTNYNTTSDYRLKENINYDWDATTILTQLRPAEFTFISDETNTVQQGFIAHEVQEHLPFAVSGIKDGMIPAVLYEEEDEEVINGEAQVGDIKEPEKIKPQQVDYSKVVPLLVKTIQELEARITTLENA